MLTNRSIPSLPLTMMQLNCESTIMHSTHSPSAHSIVSCRVDSDCGRSVGATSVCSDESLALVSAAAVSSTAALALSTARAGLGIEPLSWAFRRLGRVLKVRFMPSSSSLCVASAPSTPFAAGMPLPLLLFRRCLLNLPYAATTPRALAASAMAPVSTFRFSTGLGLSLNTSAAFRYCFRSKLSFKMPVLGDHSERIPLALAETSTPPPLAPY
mmetsp:Transcript_78638/g.225238  ORF Transcript_78638/g.225238 Transcript_78638/m.225238 type:complete len:213 (-) Transcript_78638:16-654(-)